MDIEESYWDKIESRFKRIFGKDNADVANGVLRVFVDNDEDREMACEFANLYCLTMPEDEVASDNFLRFVEISMEDEDEDDEEEDEDDGDLLSDALEEVDEMDPEVEDFVAKSYDPLDDNTRQLRVLISAESHKFASKIYHGMLDNNDLSRYPAFLMDLDAFLQQYIGDGSGEEEEDVELASIISNFNLRLEVAKGKSARSAFLGAFMQALASDAGASLIAAFAAGDVDKFAEGMGTIVVGLIESMGSEEAVNLMSRDDDSDPKLSDGDIVVPETEPTLELAP